ncbi:MAG: NAD(P)H-quinone oxidoreductase [Gemmatimonadota bacterium]
MKAVRIAAAGGPEVLELVEIPEPVARQGEALVRVRAAGLNRADLLQRRGLYPAPPGAPRDVPGLEFAGEVRKVPGAARDPAAGSGRPRPASVREGDRVMGLLGGGGYAEIVSVPAELLLPIPSDLSFAEAAAIPEAFLTAADALFERGRLEPGQRVLIHSAGGGVGSAAVQLARAGGAGRVFGTASATKLEGLARLGLKPDVGIDYRSRNFSEVIEAETGGEGVDVILDTVGAAFWDRNLASLAPLGRLVLVGLMGGRRTEADLGELMRQRLTVVGTVLRSRSRAEKASLTEEFARRFLPLFETGELRPVVDRAFPLRRAADAHRYMETNRNLGKLVLEV